MRLLILVHLPDPVISALVKMKSFTIAALAALWAQKAAAHATFQQLWVDGTDYGSQCVRLPGSNSPVTSVASNDIRCNAGASRASGKCPVKAGSTVTVEMHQVSNPQRVQRLWP